MDAQEPKRDLVELTVPRVEASLTIMKRQSLLRDIIRRQPKTTTALRLKLSALRSWRLYTYEVLRRLFSNDELATEFSSVPIEKITTEMTLHQQNTRCQTSAFNLHNSLASILDRLELYPESKPNLQPDAITSGTSIVEHLAIHFHVFASQLGGRQKDREAFAITDEYDLQDIFRALLWLFFDDIRPEEYTPSYAGKSSKIDFILKKERIVVELKMTNRNLRDKKVGDQLIIDIERYRSHPDCQTIICFVYDPEHFVKNPVGLENDLSRRQDNLDVKVIVSPK